jgi:uncharacterized protein
MLFVLTGFDRPGDGAQIRRQNRAAHLQFVVENEDKFRYGGALLDDGGKMIGSLMMVELRDRAALDRFLAEEPYSRAGLFDPYRILETRQVVPQPQPGSLAAELARERARSD